MGHNLRRIFRVIGIAFLVLLLALVRIQLLQREELARHPFNRYAQAKESAVRRGEIFDRQGQPLAIWQEDGKRHYPLGAAGGHPVGYYSRILGAAGAESWFATTLLGQEGSLRVRNAWLELAGRKGQGYQVQLTLEAGLQELGYRLLQGRKGAVVALDPLTGEILALVSSPGFDPETIEQDWDKYAGDGNSPLFNRAVAGTYPPGSTFKLVVAAAVLEADPGLKDRQFYCPGYIDIEGRRLTCSRAHEQVDLTQAIAYSCNVVFAQLGLETGEEALRQQARAFGFEQALLENVPVKPSSLGHSPMTANGLAETAIGQGQVLVTPLQMAVLAGAIANDGVLVAPSLLRGRATGDMDFSLLNTRPGATRVMSRETAAFLQQAMVGTVAYGTGWQAQLSGVEVAGKTGSAENPHGPAHAWFVGFAPAGEPRIAVAVVVENAGAGGGTGGPIVKEMINYFLSGLQ